MLLPILQSNFIHDKEFLELWSLSCFSEPVVLQVGNNNSGNFMWPPLALFWESVLVQLFKTCGWKACVLKPPPSPFLFGGGPGGCEWSLTDGKQAVWPINLSLLWLRELSVWVWRKRRVEGGKSWCSGWTSWITAYHDFWEQTDGSYGTETVFMLKRVWIHAQCPSDLSEKLCYKKSFV